VTIYLPSCNLPPLPGLSRCRSCSSIGAEPGSVGAWLTPAPPQWTVVREDGGSSWLSSRDLQRELRDGLLFKPVDPVRGVRTGKLPITPFQELQLDYQDVSASHQLPVKCVVHRLTAREMSVICRSLTYKIRHHGVPTQETGPSPDGPATNDVGGWHILWFLLDLAAVYVLVELFVPWLAGWTRNTLLPILQHPTPSGRFEFLFSHILGLSFIPAFLVGLINARFKRKAAQFVWLIPAAILAYKFVTFPAPSVLQNHFPAACHQYFGGRFVVPEFRSWKELYSIATSDSDMTRGMAQLRFTGPFYAGVGYSLAAWIGCRTELIRKTAEGVKKWGKA
jgi:hypothetical protein